MGRWQYARAIFDQSFQPLLAAGYTLQRVDRTEYRAIHDAALGEHFPPEYFFDLAALRSAAEVEGQARLEAERGDEPLRDYNVLYAGSLVVATFSGHQRTAGLYHMQHSNVHREHRRRGIYRMILEGTLRYTAALGFDTVTSEHAPCNNAILIAKLRAGFQIYALEIDPCFGPSVVLRYFHNPEHRAAFEARCGMASITPGLAAHATGAWARFRDQVRGA